MFRVVLLWVTFFQLNYLKERVKRHHKSLAHRQRQEATMRTRRGLLRPNTTVVLQLTLPILFCLAMIYYIVPSAYHAGSALGLLKHEMRLLPREASVAAMVHMRSEINSKAGGEIVPYARTLDGAPRKESASRARAAGMA